LTRSWFNRRTVTLKSAALGGTGVAIPHAGTPAEVSTALRLQFVIFANEASSFQCSCQFFTPNINTVISFYIEYDGTTLALPATAYSTTDPNLVSANPTFDNSQMSEGVHYATLYGLGNGASTAYKTTYILGTVSP
jgi:hypothetical protein